MQPQDYHIYCTVTNDLSFDQRMHRICGSLARAGYKVTLVGRSTANSLPLDHQPFEQVRLNVSPEKGKRFYWAYNKALFRFLQTKAQAHQQPGAANMAICAIDLDSIVPCLLVSKKYRLPRLYDAHELFTELTEVKRRPWIAAIWKVIEAWCVPQFQYGYTVNQFIADEFSRRYRVKYAVVRNMPMPAGNTFFEALPAALSLPERFFLYQGAVNEGRAFDELIAAMKETSLPLVIAGDGNYMEQVKSLIAAHGVADKVFLTGHLKPAVLRGLTQRAFAGITLFNNSGLNQYYSLANRFFDYVQAGKPQVCVRYPEYEHLNQQHEVAVLVNEVAPGEISQAMNLLAKDAVLYETLAGQSTVAATVWNWTEEEKNMLQVWANCLQEPLKQY